MTCRSGFRFATLLVLPKFNTAQHGSARSIVLGGRELGQIHSGGVVETPHGGIRDGRRYRDGQGGMPNELSNAPDWSYQRCYFVVMCKFRPGQIDWHHDCIMKLPYNTRQHLTQIHQTRELSRPAHPAGFFMRA